MQQEPVVLTEDTGSQTCSTGAVGFFAECAHPLIYTLCFADSRTCIFHIQPLRSE